VKLQRHICDLCGGTIRKDEPHATMTVPNLKKIAATPSAEVQAQALFAGLVLGFGGSAHDSQTYDVCRHCVTGLLAARELVQRTRDKFEKETA
jgi:hypothetical protein